MGSDYKGSSGKLALWLKSRKPLAIGLAFFIIISSGFLIKRFKGKKEAVFKGGKDKKSEKSKGSSEDLAQEPVPVNVMVARRQRFQDAILALGTIVGGSEIELRFETEGVIENYSYHNGNKIAEGQVIAKLNQREAILKLKKAEVEMDQYEKLYALGGISRSRLEQARLAVDLAKTDLAKTVIESPLNGILGDRDAEVGEFVNPTKRIGTLVNIETVKVQVGIIEKEIDRIAPGQKVVVSVDTYPGAEFAGKVENISPLVQGTSKTLSVEARLNNEGGLLLPGMFARSRIVIFEDEQAMVVPNDSLVKSAGGFQVYVVTPDNIAELRSVEVGYVSTEETQISSGLNIGEMVVIQKSQDLKAGTPVKIIEVQRQ